MTEEREASVQVLKTFAPLDGLKRENIAALAKKVSIRKMSAGRYLFKEGDTDKRKVWLVSGMVELREGERTVGMIRGGTADARNPLSPTLPRAVSARAVDEISYLSIDSELLDVMITWDQTGTYEVEELQAQLNGGANGDDRPTPPCSRTSGRSRAPGTRTRWARPGRTSRPTTRGAEGSRSIPF